MKKILVSLVFAAVLPLSAQQKPVYLDESKPIEERVEDALPRLMEFVRRCYGMNGIRQAGQMILVWLFLH